VLGCSLKKAIKQNLRVFEMVTNVSSQLSTWVKKTSTDRLNKHLSFIHYVMLCKIQNAMQKQSGIAPLSHYHCGSQLALFVYWFCESSGITIFFVIMFFANNKNKNNVCCFLCSKSKILV